MIPLDEPFSHRFPGITFGAIGDELRREIAARARTYPGQVDKGRMTAAEAERQQQLFAALLADFGDLVTVSEPSRTGPSWTERREALGRELDQRARLYPHWVATARLTEADAAHRIACLEALLELYDGGWGWAPSRPCPVHPTLAEMNAWRAEWTAAWQTTRTAAKLGQAGQREMALS